MSAIDLNRRSMGSSLRPLKAVQRASDLLLLWAERTQQRRALRRLDDHLLRDLGVTRTQVEAEAEKPFWRA